MSSENINFICLLSEDESVVSVKMKELLAEKKNALKQSFHEDRPRKSAMKPRALMASLTKKSASTAKHIAKTVSVDMSFIFKFEQINLIFLFDSSNHQR